MILFALALVAVLLGVLIALVVDRRLRQARRQREQWLMDQAFERAAATPPQRLREMAAAVQTSIDRGESFQQFRERARLTPPAPEPARCPTTQPHHYLPGSIYAPASDTRSDCGSSWSSSGDSGGSSCDSSSSSSGGGE